MKRILVLFLALSVALIGVACGTKEATKVDTPRAEGKVAEKPKEESKYAFPNSTEKGKGKISVQTASGDSAKGQTPVLFSDKDDILIQVGYTLENFQGDKEVFLYVNKKFQETTQAGEMMQGSLPLEGELLKPNQYTVTAVQFADNDPKKGEVIEYHEAKFEVKASQ
ncbi:hypothetical protein SAMN04487866_1383 [Thermoactinomyces sp. DSM 45891]|uniref:hypothetical protein n=1 Tax=Thermoactinomyces sp. DSM 45891 TaxID=1761907 RepID=UPI00092483EB|nr:hypothetical protein [Thermoactinomyces sp. DSM 45891]SFX83705.1 hypothetical protein SAMN04487866_1383 [Thermoactinomyces sp. DSM 45891]